MRRVFLLSAFLLVLGIPKGWAISINPAIDYKVVTGNQTWTGALGMAFQVNTPIVINGLGVFDSGGNGLSRDIYVEIRQLTSLPNGNVSSPVNLASSPAASATFLAANVYPLIGGARWQQISEVVLGTGNWMIIARGYGLGEPNYNAGGGPNSNHVNSLNTFGGAITWGIGPYLGNAYGTGLLPDTWDYWNGGGPVIRYGAGTFSVPEPSTYALMGTVGLALYLLRRRKSKKTEA